MDRRGIWATLATAVVTVGGAAILTTAASSTGVDWGNPGMIGAYVLPALGFLLFVSLMTGKPFERLGPSNVPAIAAAARLRGRELLEECPDPQQGPVVDFATRAFRVVVNRWVVAVFADLFTTDPKAADRFGSDLAEADTDLWKFVATRINRLEKIV